MSKLNYNSLKILNKYNNNKLDLSVFGDQNKLNDSLQSIDMRYDELYDKTSKVANISITENKTVKASDNNLYGYTKVQVNVPQGFAQGGYIPYLGGPFGKPSSAIHGVQLSSQFTYAIPKFKVYKLLRRESKSGMKGYLIVDTADYIYIPAGTFELYAINCPITADKVNLSYDKVGNLIVDETNYTITIENNTEIAVCAALAIKVGTTPYIVASSDIPNINVSVAGSNIEDGGLGGSVTIENIDLTLTARGNLNIKNFIYGLTFVRDNNYNYTFSTRPFGIIGG